MRRTLIWTAALGAVLVGGVAAATPPGPPAAVAALKRLGPDVTVRWRADSDRPAVIRGLSVATTGKTARARATGFVSRHPEIFLPAAQLRVAEERAAAGVTVVRMTQVTPAGVPVDGGELTVAMDERGRVTAVHSELKTLGAAVPKVKIDGRAALAIALGRLAGMKGPAAVPAELSGLRPTLMVIPGRTPRPVYKVTLPLYLDMLGRIHLVDAVTGAPMGWRPGMIVDGHHHGKGVRP